MPGFVRPLLAGLGLGATLGCGTFERSGEPPAESPAEEAMPEVDPSVSSAFIWEPCGTIPGVPEVARVDPAPGPVLGHAIRGAPYEITSLSITPDGTRLASNGAEVLLWDIAEPFENSTPTWLTGGRPEHPIVDLSPDGQTVAISGDGRRLVDASGTFIAAASEQLPVAGQFCSWPELRFSPDGRWLAGTGWDEQIDIFDATDFTPVLSVFAGCGMRLAFSPKGDFLVTSDQARLRAGDWQPTADPIGRAPACAGFESCTPLRKSVTVSPNGSAILTSDRCPDRDDEETYCTLLHEQGATLDLPALSAPFPDFSAEGHWIVSGGVLLHLPSGQTRVFDANAVVALFAPNGDIIAADAAFGLTRYCRH